MLTANWVHITVGSTLSCKHSAEFHILIWLGFEYGTFCMQGELSTQHRRVIIGSLWSTWRLRAQRKQLSLHSALDCLSQQTSFPSPLHLFFKFPPQNNLVQRVKEQVILSATSEHAVYYIVAPVDEDGLFPVKILPFGPAGLSFTSWNAQLSGNSALLKVLNLRGSSPSFGVDEPVLPHFPNCPRLLLQFVQFGWRSLINRVERCTLHSGWNDNHVTLLAPLKGLVTSGICSCTFKNLKFLEAWWCNHWANELITNILALVSLTSSPGMYFLNTPLLLFFLEIAKVSLLASRNTSIQTDVWRYQLLLLEQFFLWQRRWKKANELL